MDFRKTFALWETMLNSLIHGCIIPEWAMSTAVQLSNANQWLIGGLNNLKNLKPKELNHEKSRHRIFWHHHKFYDVCR